MSCPGFWTTTAPVPWTVAWGTSACLSQRALLGVRVLIALTLLGHWVVNVYEQVIVRNEGIFYFFFLTRQSFLLETLYAVLLPFLTWHAQRSMASQASGFQLFGGGAGDASASPPMAARAMMALFMAIQPLAFMVVVLYWTLFLPFWQLCALTGGEQPCEPLPGYISLFVHGIDFVILIVSFFISRMPYFLSNSLWLMLYATAYIAWSYVHFLLRIGRGPGSEQDCAELGYSLRDCPLYSFLDWHKPASTGVLVGSIYAACLVLILVYRGLQQFRSVMSPEDASGGQGAEPGVAAAVERGLAASAGRAEDAAASLLRRSD